MSTAEEETATARQANSIAPAREDTTNTSPQQTAGEEHQDAQPPSTMVVDSGAVVVNNEQEGETAAAAVDDDDDSIAKEKEEPLNLALQKDTIAKETAARIVIDTEHDSLFHIAQLGRCVREEDLLRATVQDAEEPRAWQALVEASRRSFDEALELDDLQSQLREAEKELRETETGIHAEEVLLAYLTETTQQSNQWKAQLENHQQTLQHNQSELARIQALLQSVPPESADVIQQRVDELDTLIHQQQDAAEDHKDSTSASGAAVAALGKIWEDAQDALEAATTELDALTTMPALQRCEVLQSRHEALVARVTDMYNAHEETVRTVSEAKSTITGELQKLFEKEMKALLIPRKQLQQIEDEQLHHIRRGTFVKERQVDSTTQEQLATKRVHNDHTQLCTKLVALKADIRVVQNEVRDLKRSLDDLESGKSKTRSVLNGKLDEMRADADSFETMRVKLQEESEDLKGLRVELMKVLQYSKLQKKC